MPGAVSDDLPDAVSDDLPDAVSGDLPGAVSGDLLPTIVVSALSIALYAMFIAIIIPQIPFQRIKKAP